MEPYEKTRKVEENFSGLDFHEIPKFVQEISALHSRSSEMLLLSIFLAARSKAIRNAKWADFDLEKKNLEHSESRTFLLRMTRQKI